MSLQRLSYRLFACLMALASGDTLAGLSLTVGGKVNASSGVADPNGSQWIAYPLGAASEQATGLVGGYSSGYWAGDLGAVVTDLNFGDSVQLVIEREHGTGTLDHQGFFASSQHQLGNSDPGLFTAVQLVSLPVPTVSVAAGWNATLSWTLPTQPGVAGVRLYRSSDGITFEALGDFTSGETETIDVGFPTSTRYYALSLIYSGTPRQAGGVLSANSSEMIDTDGDGQLNSVDLDDDDDGMPDSFEQTHGFNPLNPADAALDADEDGISNLKEFEHGLDPHSNDATTDPDNDGLNNLAETIAGTQVNNPDTDDDGATDGEEVDAESDPLSADSVPNWMRPSGGSWRYALPRP